MSTDFRALCAELIASWDADGCDWKPQHQARWEATVNRARAALADEPAVPEVVGSEWQPCVKLPITVHVREQRPGEQHVSTREGITPVQSDDLIMLGVDGEEYPIGRELFQRTYRMGSADEPASVTGQPSDQELLDIAASTIEPYECSGITTDEYEPETECAVEAYGSELIAFARAVLAHWGNPAPLPPAKGEVAELVNALKGIAYWRRHNKPGGLAPAPFDIRQADRLDRAADLLHRLNPPQPVPVSERPPGPEDCDAEGRCWWGRDESDDWYADWTLATHKAVAEFCGFSPQTVWLPAHSLPLPEVGE